MTITTYENLDLSDFSSIFVIENKKLKAMFYIYEKNLNTNNVRVLMKVPDRNVAERKVMEMNEVSLYDDKFYFIKEVNE